MNCLYSKPKRLLIGKLLNIMNIKKILARLWALWGIIIFIPTMLIVVWLILFTFLIKEPTGTEVFRRVSKIWMRFFLTSIGCSIKVVGKGHFKKGEVYIIVSNHNSLMDIPLTTPFIPGANKTIAKTSFANIPFFGWIYRRGSILVNRNDVQSRAKSIEAMKAMLQKGLHICIYPEGSRNRTAEPLKSFYDGAFKLAIGTQKNIIPCLLFNTQKVLPINNFFYLWPHQLELHFLPPVQTNNFTSVETLKEVVHNLMKDYYVGYKK